MTISLSQFIADAQRAEKLLEAIRTYKDGEEPTVCRGPKPLSKYPYAYLGDGIWIRGDMPVEKWKELIESLPPKVQVTPTKA